MLKSRDHDGLIQKQLNAGEVSALEYLFHQYYDDLCRYVVIYIKDIDIAENIVQDLYVYIWEHRETIEIHHSFESYLYQAARYKALNYKRDNLRKADKISFLTKQNVDKVSVSADEAIELKELNVIINEAIKLLPERCQQIFKLSRSEELSYREIAELMQISISTVDNQVNTAIKRFRTHVHRYYPEMYITVFVLGLYNL
jgi:RNA polymerase sigma-70 factor (ECF subfamily)